MPSLVIQTNAACDASQAEALTAAASKAVSTVTGKPEDYVMVLLQHEQTMRFGGSAKPAALLTLRSIGLPEDREAVADAVSTAVAQSAGVPPERIYCVMEDIARTHWAMGGKTFG